MICQCQSANVVIHMVFGLLCGTRAGPKWCICLFLIEHRKTYHGRLNLSELRYIALANISTDYCSPKNPAVHIVPQVILPAR